MKHSPARDQPACPVCGMESDVSMMPCKLNGSEYFFCSEQCRERFSDHPTLFSAYKKFAQAPLYKQRFLRLKMPLSAQQQADISQLPNDMMGIQRVDLAGQQLSIEYDLLQATLAQIEARLRAMKIPLAEGWRERIKSAWRHEREETELDNLSARKAPCCNQSPRGR